MFVTSLDDGGHSGLLLNLIYMDVHSRDFMLN